MTALKVVIPARLGSTRLPRKPLADLGGKPMVVRTFEAAVSAVGADNVVVAADHESVVQAVEKAGGQAVMTSAAHENGTERVAEAARLLGFAADQIVVNLQGDEPLMPPRLITAVGDALRGDPAAEMATLAASIIDARDIANPNIVKLVRGDNGHALYFSRAAIPHVRDPQDMGEENAYFLRHVGLYAYRVSTLNRVASLPPVAIEQAEKLEQLRALSAGIKIHVALTDDVPPHGVDTPEMLQAVSEILVGQSGVT